MDHVLYHQPFLRKCPSFLTYTCGTFAFSVRYFIPVARLSIVDSKLEAH